MTTNHAVIKWAGSVGHDLKTKQLAPPVVYMTLRTMTVCDSDIQEQQYSRSGLEVSLWASSRCHGILAPLAISVDRWRRIRDLESRSEEENCADLSTTFLYRSRVVYIDCNTVGPGPKTKQILKRRNSAMSKREGQAKDCLTQRCFFI